MELQKQLQSVLEIPLCEAKAKWLEDDEGALCEEPKLFVFRSFLVWTNYIYDLYDICVFFCMFSSFFCFTGPTPSCTRLFHRIF